MIEGYFAKDDGTTLIKHSQDVRDAGLKILNVLDIDINYWKPKVIRTAILHDFGKIHPIFQAKLHSQSINNVAIRHELISILHCLNIPIDELFAIATHHKGIIKIGESNSKRLSLNVVNISVQQNNEIKELADSLFSEWHKHFDIIFSESYIDVKDFIKVINATFQSNLSDEERMNFALMRALLITADHLASAGQHTFLPKPLLIEICNFQPQVEGVKIDFRNFQSIMSTIVGDALLHAPTGSGKTEAAMCWVTKNQSKNSRLFYLLPYTASANAMVKRLCEIYGENQVTALHSKTLDFFFDELCNEYEEKLDDIEFKLKVQTQAKNKKLLSKEIFYPVKVATPHQIIKNATLSRGWEMCLWEYKNATFIIDEFHTYDALLTGLIFATVKWLKREFDAKILFMSATIPQFVEKYILNHILDGDATKIIKPNKNEKSDALILGKKRHILSFQEEETISININKIERLLLQRKKVLVIVNNVSTAQNIFSEIKFNPRKSSLLHSGFNRRDRIEIEKNITSKDEDKIPQLLVATQAVEVSLDIDYDCAFIENAPIDALIQRFGRVNRTGKKDLAQIVLIKNNEGKTPFYDEDICVKTWKELKKFENVPLSEDNLIESCNVVYKDGYNLNQQKDFEIGLNNEIINNFKSKLIAGDWSNAFEEAFENDNQKIEILCENLIDEYKILINQKRFIEANQLLVSVYYYQLEGRKTKDKDLNVIVGYDFIYDPTVGYRKKKLSENLLL